MPVTAELLEELEELATARRAPRLRRLGRHRELRDAGRAPTASWIDVRVLEIIRGQPRPGRPA